MRQGAALCALLGLLGAEAPAAARGPEARPIVAVMEIEDRAGALSRRDIEAATDILRGLLAASRRFVVVDKGRQGSALRRLVRREKKASYGACYDDGCQIPLGKALSADRIVRGYLSRLGGQLTLTAEVIDLAREASVGAGHARFAAEPRATLPDRLGDALVVVANQLTGAPPPSVVRRPAPAAPVGPGPAAAAVEDESGFPEWHGILGMVLFGGGYVGEVVGVFVTPTDGVQKGLGFIPVVGPLAVDMRNLDTGRSSNPLNYLALAAQLTGFALVLIDALD